MIAVSDLPRNRDEGVIFDLDDGSTIEVGFFRPGHFEGIADKFDVSGTAEEIVAKLNSWGARLVGWN